MEKTRKWRYGFKRYIVLVLIVLGIIGANTFPPIRPHIQVAPEVIGEIAGFPITNTLVAMVLMDVLIVGMALAVRSALKKGTLVPGGITGAVETLLEVLYNLTESTAGKWTKRIFPIFATIVIVVLFANWLELIPGVDSIGRLENSAQGYPTIQIIPGVVDAIVSGKAAQGAGQMVLPFLRVLSTDLNFTIALAIIAVVMTQVIGFQAQGWRYLLKFFNVTTLFSKPGFGAIDFAVGILELISEFSKLLSFAFRLFGNIFAGAVLLFLVGSMMPVFAQSAVLLFEFAIGAIQAFVFGMLTMVFMSQATHGHGEEHEESHAEAQAAA